MATRTHCAEMTESSIHDGIHYVVIYILGFINDPAHASSCTISLHPLVVILSHECLDDSIFIRLSPSCDLLKHDINCYDSHYKVDNVTKQKCVLLQISSVVQFIHNEAVY